jgi:arsenical pump membrane protein
MTPEALILGIAGLATVGVIVRPFDWPEAVWAVAGAALMVALGLMSPATALRGIARGADVYMFLAGMMLLSEVARREGLFDFLAVEATAYAGGSPRRLFLLIYLVGVAVTVFLSNDATAVVLTPAVLAATQAARIDQPRPYLFICALVANAASFVLPISNPANLVIYGGAMPPLWVWLRTFGLASLASIVATYAALRFWFRGDLRGRVAEPECKRALPLRGKIAAAGIGATALALVAASAMGRDLGPPTLIAGAATAFVVLAIRRGGLLALVRGISWGVLPLVAGLFIFVEALDQIGVTARIAELFRALAQAGAPGPFAAGGAVAVVANFVNNLPTGLIAASALRQAGSPQDLTNAVLVGIDLGPNFSVTGSLATILWLNALRREGQKVGALDFLIVGAVVTPPALILALAALKI